jgi:hypothetical protein
MIADHPPTLVQARLAARAQQTPVADSLGARVVVGKCPVRGHHSRVCITRLSVDPDRYVTHVRVTRQADGTLIVKAVVQ